MCTITESEAALIVLCICRTIKDPSVGKSGIWCIPKLTLLSKCWNEACMSEMVWKDLFYDDFGIELRTTSDTNKSKRSQISWRDRYFNSLSDTLVASLSNNLFQFLYGHSDCSSVCWWLHWIWTVSFHTAKAISSTKSQSDFF